MSKMGQITSSRTEPVEPTNLQKKASETYVEQVASTTPEKDAKGEHEMQTLRDELSAQEALRERQRE